METRKQVDGPCLLLARKASPIDRAKTVCLLAVTALVAQIRTTSRLAWPYLAEAKISTSRAMDALHVRLVSWRIRAAERLLARAVQAGLTSSDIDSQAAGWRMVMWALVALTLIAGIAVGWKAVFAPALLAVVAGTVAVLLWDVAAELEHQERSL
ncbi:MAG: hypothetical protein ACM3SS_07480 [Rhodospirillaceae bacterium]